MTPTYLVSEIHRQHAEIEQLRARIAELEERLEIDHCYQIIDGKQTRVEIPPNERGQQPDGIECRNETIKLLDARIIIESATVERCAQWLDDNLDEYERWQYSIVGDAMRRALKLKDKP